MRSQASQEWPDCASVFAAKSDDKVGAPAAEQARGSAADHVAAVDRHLLQIEETPGMLQLTLFSIGVSSPN